MYDKSKIKTISKLKKTRIDITSNNINGNKLSVPDAHFDNKCLLSDAVTELCIFKVYQINKKLITKEDSKA